MSECQPGAGSQRISARLPALSCPAPLWPLPGGLHQQQKGLLHGRSSASVPHGHHHITSRRLCDFQHPQLHRTTAASILLSPPSSTNSPTPRRKWMPCRCCPAACRSTTAICNHGVQGMFSPTSAISEIGALARDAAMSTSSAAFHSLLIAPGGQPHPLLRNIQAFAHTPPAMIFTVCSPAWRVGDFLFAPPAITAYSLPRLGPSLPSIVTLFHPRPGSATAHFFRLPNLPLLGSDFLLSIYSTIPIPISLTPSPTHHPRHLLYCFCNLLTSVSGSLLIVS